ncbi:hypothetical protein JIY74_27380 [Vibrio harveyi]|nr:hypothetical protein [Vibrio harveyi]
MKNIKLNSQKFKLVALPDGEVKFNDQLAGLLLIIDGANAISNGYKIDKRRINVKPVIMLLLYFLLAVEKTSFAEIQSPSEIGLISITIVAIANDPSAEPAINDKDILILIYPFISEPKVFRIQNIIKN